MSLRLLAVLGLLPLVALTANAQAPPIKGVILQFNGKEVDKVPASTKEKAFRPIFEKHLATLADKLPGKPDLKVSHWYTIINGGAIRWTKGPDDTAEKLMAELKKLPFVKSVEPDRPVGIGLPKLPKE